MVDFPVNHRIQRGCEDVLVQLGRDREILVRNQRAQLEQLARAIEAARRNGDSFWGALGRTLLSVIVSVVSQDTPSLHYIGLNLDALRCRQSSPHNLPFDKSHTPIRPFFSLHCPHTCLITINFLHFESDLIVPSDYNGVGCF